MKNKELSLQKAKQMAVSEDINQLDFNELIANIENDEILKKFAPDGVCQIDPRDGNLVIYNASRAKRAHFIKNTDNKNNKKISCPICAGDSSEIFDIATQSEGFCFINKNIYPIFHTIENLPEELPEYFLHQDLHHNGRASYGFHLLQWTSSLHDKDWHSLSHADALIAFNQLTKLEEKLLCQPTDFMYRSRMTKENNCVSGYVSIIKNYGADAGASLEHGHQQIAYSNILPQMFFNNLQFKKRNDISFSHFMLNSNPDDLLVKDFGEVVVIVPYFMKRAFDMIIIIKNYEKRYLYELTKIERQQLTLAMQYTMQAIIDLMTEIDQPPAYNMIINNGPGCGLYIEFLAQTQKMGGYEHLGLYICQANAQQTAKQLRAKFAEYNS